MHLCARALPLFLLSTLPAHAMPFGALFAVSLLVSLSHPCFSFFIPHSGPAHLALSLAAPRRAQPTASDAAQVQELLFALLSGPIDGLSVLVASREAVAPGLKLIDRLGSVAGRLTSLTYCFRCIQRWRRPRARPAVMVSTSLASET